MKNNKVINQLNENGIFIYKNFIDKYKCQLLIDKFESYLTINNLIWVDDTQSDKRIYGIDIIDTEFRELFNTEDLNNIYSKYISSNNKYSFIMANKVTYKENNLGSGGGWHRDTFFSKQLKFILYLNDVDESNGAFEFVYKSHHFSHKLKDFFRFSIFKDNIRRYSNILFKNSTKITGSAGDLIIVDTSGIHRGNPIQIGHRYALTNYLSHNKFSKGLINLLPKQ